MTKVVTYIEIDVDYCSLIYGVAPCEAVLATGGKKCFNTLATCQDLPHFDNEPVTLRFAMRGTYLPVGVRAIPALLGVNITPSQLSLGKDLGQRATVTASFIDHKHSDTGEGFDKYVTERPYNPYEQGSFFGKFRARQPYLRGRPFRLIRGIVGQTLEEMETRHYIIEAFQGPDVSGQYSISAKDVLKLADGDRSQAPRLSQGFLVANITAVATSATLSPSGIGNFEYPTSGWVNIGGNEVAAFTRVGDVLTLTRGQLGTTAGAHEADDRVQVVLRIAGEDPADILRLLFVDYALIPDAYIPYADWLQETALYLGRVYSATLTEPVSVGLLAAELAEQAGLVIWWDERASRIRMQVLRSILTDADEYTPDNVLEGSVSITEQPDTRVSQVWTYYGQKDPTRSLEDQDNFSSTVLTVDLEAEDFYGTPAIRRIYSRWIPRFGRLVAERLNDIILGRFRDPPRRVSFEVLRYAQDEPMLGGGYRFEAWPLQDDTGAAIDIPIQLVRLNHQADRFLIEAEEVSFNQLDAQDLTDRQILIDVNAYNLNIRDVHDTLFPEFADPLPTGTTLTVTVAEGVIVGSLDVDLSALDIDTNWPVGLPILLKVQGRIQGRGGEGGRGRVDGDAPDVTPGEDGGTALYVRRAITVDYTEGNPEIFGGGGGGGGSRSVFQGGGGGGGAGQLGGDGGTSDNPSRVGDPGTANAGGAPGPGAGAGGGPGLDGVDDSSSGGDKGTAIDGVSFVTVVGSGDIRGPQVN